MSTPIRLRAEDLENLSENALALLRVAALMADKEEALKVIDQEGLRRGLITQGQWDEVYKLPTRKAAE